MTWTQTTSDGNEAAKVRYDILPYVRGRGLDIGCGPWKCYEHMIGVDAQVYTGPSTANIRSDVRNLDIFATESMDFVFSSHTLEHIEEAEATLREWWRLVKVGGCLILYLPHADFYPRIGQEGANVDHKHDFLPTDIIAMMKSNGSWDLEVNQDRNDGNEYSFLQVWRKRAAGAECGESWANPPPAKKAAVIRYGAYGDALWASSVLPALKADGYHVTVYTQEQGEEILRHDPHIDRIIVHSTYLTPGGDLVPYWAHEALKYDKWCNLVHSVESRILPAPQDVAFHWSDELRRAMMDVNYLEAVHAFAGVPYVPKQKFYPTAEEAEWARAKRAEFPGRLVVLNPVGSTWPKYWPYASAFSEAMAQRQIHTVVIGDPRGDPPALPETFGHYVGKDWTIRQAMAFAALADVVIGEESALVNAVAFEEPLKIVLLSHSTPTNLTRDWPNTVALQAEGLPCYPCHRIHADQTYCITERHTQSAACQAVLQPNRVVMLVDDYFVWRDGQKAA